MRYVISFESRRFDLDNEEENPINPLKGDFMKNVNKTIGLFFLVSL